MNISQIKSEWQRMMNCSTSTSEDDYDVISYPSNPRKRTNMYLSDTSSSDNETYYSKRHCLDISSDCNFISAHGHKLSPVATRRAFRMRTEDIKRSALIAKRSPRDGARKTSSVITRKQSQLKLVVCASARKLTVTVLGMTSLPPSCTSRDIPTYVYLKLSLSPDHENRIRFKTNPELVKSNSITLHDTFAFDVHRRDSNRRLLISAWGKDDFTDRSSFIGCMSFGLKRLLATQEVVQGWYYLLSESLGRKKHLAVKVIADFHQHHKSRVSHANQLKVTSVKHSPQKSTRKVLGQIYSENSDSSLASFPRLSYAKNYSRRERQAEKRANGSNRKSLKRRRTSGDSDGSPEVKRRGRDVTSGSGDVTEEKLSSFCKLSIGQRQSRDSVAEESRTPTGRRHVRRKSYSSTDLLLFRMSYYGNAADSDSDSDSDDDDLPYFLSKEPIQIQEENERRRKTSSESNESLPLQEVAVCRTEAKSAKILTQKIRSNPENKENESESSDHFVTESCVFQHRVSHVARRRKLIRCQQTPHRSSRVFLDEDDLKHPEEIILDIAQKETSRNRVSDVDDRGYHSAVTSSSHTSSSSSDEETVASKITQMKSQDSASERVRASPTKRYAKQPQSKHKVALKEASPVCTVATASKVTSQRASKVTLKTEARRQNSSEIPQEKTRPSSLYSLKSWFQRKGNENLLSSSKAPKSLSTGWLLKYKSAEGDTTRELKRTFSLRKATAKTCDSCEISTKSLVEVLKRKDGFAAFRAFLQNEFSEENLDFWVETESYKQAKSSKRQKIATKIFDRYLAVDSPKEINIDAKCRSSVEAKLAEQSLETFDDARNHIFKLMEKDSFKRFQISEYRKCKCQSFLSDII